MQFILCVTMLYHVNTMKKVPDTGYSDTGVLLVQCLENVAVQALINPVPVYLII